MGYYSIIDCVRANDLADDLRSKVVETDVLARLIGLLQDPSSNIRQSSVEVITTLSKFGRLIWIISYYARTNDPTDDFRSQMLETDVLSRLLGLLQDQGLDVRQSSTEAITTFAMFGRLMYQFVLWGTDDLSDNFRSKMGGKEFLAHLVGLLQDPDSSLRLLSIKVITTLAKFGTLIYYIVYNVRDQWFVRRSPLQDGGNRRSFSCFWLASTPGLRHTSVICRSHYYFSKIW